MASEIWRGSTTNVKTRVEERYRMGSCLLGRDWILTITPMWVWSSAAGRLSRATSALMSNLFGTTQKACLFWRTRSSNFTGYAPWTGDSSGCTIWAWALPEGTAESGRSILEIRMGFRVVPPASSLPNWMSIEKTPATCVYSDSRWSVLALWINLNLPILVRCASRARARCGICCKPTLTTISKMARAWVGPNVVTLNSKDSRVKYR